MPQTRHIFLQPAVLVGVTLKGPYDESVPRAWQKLFRWLSSEGLHSANGRGYGLAHDDPRKLAASELRYTAAVALPPGVRPTGLNEITTINFDGGEYSFERYWGPYEYISSIISSVRDQWLPENDLELDPQRPVVTMYYTDPRNHVAEDQVSDLCLPIRSKRGQPLDTGTTQTVKGLQTHRSFLVTHPRVPPLH